MERTERIDRGMERTDGASMEQQQQAWGKLVRVGPSTESVLTLLLVNKECTVGRRKGCDLSFPANKLVSSDHCKLTQDQESGQVWLEDTSTNGTVINMSKLLKKQRHLLQNGDVIYFVYRKSEPEQNIAYVYHSITETHSDSQDTEELSCPELMERIDPDVDPDPVEPVTLPFVPQEVKIRPGFHESQPSTSYNIAANTHSNTHSAEQSSVKRTDGERETDECAQPDRKRQKTDDPYRAYTVGESGAPAAPPKSGKDGGEGCKTDKMEESLTCIICQDLLYDCVSLQPCMHTFCAACYSGWMERSSLCPTCRCPVERIRKNHILNNLVEADTSDLSQPYMTCRQCPGYKKDFSPAPWICGSTSETGPTAGDGPSTSSDTCTETQEFTCPPHGSHLICTCCLQPMPDRRAEHVGTNPSPQHCLVCQRPFCHLYWGCQRIGCQGCLARFSDLNLTDKCLDGVLNNNHYESEILQNYLSSRGKTWKEILQETLQNTQQGLCHLSGNLTTYVSRPALRTEGVSWTMMSRLWI
ncbi:hypothetical protein AMELA_G00236140 [Ameiurus melas]|uniref:E3 ubiquitin-protein ligase CHFR n=1 Tax=Ameiurus melas TaxID=219545 RepID=A0A7J5ZW50_AMEME|nr:hypothetical protein AMELA_G00236140 [Ameiurus melas]